MIHDLRTPFHFLLICLILSQSGCSPLVDKPDHLAWHEVYAPIEDAEAHQFLKSGIRKLVEDHGSPGHPIRTVLLRHSMKTPSAQAYRMATGFSRTEIVDLEKGIFCLYVAVPPSHERFYYLLGHEIGHLLRPDIIGSPSEESFCNEFARQLCAQEGRPYQDNWETRHWVP